MGHFFTFVYLCLFLFARSNASNSTSPTFCTAIDLFGYYPLYVSEACAAAGSPDGTATAHQCSGKSCDAATFESPCSDGLYTPKEQCLQGYCAITWESTCQEDRVVRQTYWSMGTCSIEGYDSVEGGSQSQCESRGGIWTWPVSQQACRDAAAKHHYIYFARCPTCNDNYKCLVSNTGIAGYVINGWTACNVYSPTSCSDCASFTTPESCDAQPARRWTTAFTYDSSRELTTFWFPDGLVVGESIFYGNFRPGGLRGEIGPVGAPGPVGPNGTKGEKGDKGDKGDSPFKGNYDPSLAVVYVYLVGDIVSFNGELFHLTNRLYQGEPKTFEGAGWASMTGKQGKNADPIYRGNFDQNIADELGYKISDIVMMSDGQLYQLTSLLNQNDPVAGADDSSGWALMVGRRGEKGERGERGFQGLKGDPGPAGGPQGERGPSIFKGAFEPELAAQLYYDVGDIVLMSDGDFYALNSKVNQNDPITGEADSDGWRPIRGPRGEKGRSNYRGTYDPADNSYTDGDVVRSSVDGMLYQLIGENNGYPELESSNWVSLRGSKGEQGEQGIQGKNGTDGATGATGAQGERGFNGTDGATGATGATGAKGEKGDVGRSNFRGIYDINKNAEYERGDIVEYNSLIYALIEETSGGQPGVDSSWLSLQGVGIIPEDTSIGLGWIMLIALVASLIVGTVFCLVYYLVISRGSVANAQAKIRRSDIPPVRAMVVEDNIYYRMN